MPSATDVPNSIPIAESVKAISKSLQIACHCIVQVVSTRRHAAAERRANAMSMLNDWIDGTVFETLLYFEIRTTRQSLNSTGVVNKPVRNYSLCDCIQLPIINTESR